jgi:hypothetical protein
VSADALIVMSGHEYVDFPGRILFLAEFTAMPVYVAGRWLTPLRIRKVSGSNIAASVV